MVNPKKLICVVSQCGEGKASFFQFDIFALYLNVDFVTGLKLYIMCPMHIKCQIFGW